MSEVGLTMDVAMGICTHPVLSAFPDKRQEFTLLGASSTASWRVFGGETHELPGADLFPARTVAASYGNINVKLFWEWIGELVDTSNIPPMQRGFRRWKDELRQAQIDLDRLIESAAGECGFAITMDQSRSINIPMGPGQMVEMPLRREWLF